MEYLPHHDFVKLAALQFAELSSWFVVISSLSSHCWHWQPIHVQCYSDINWDIRSNIAVCKKCSLWGRSMYLFSVPHVVLLTTPCRKSFKIKHLYYSKQRMIQSNQCVFFLLQIIHLLTYPQGGNDASDHWAFSKVFVDHSSYALHSHTFFSQPINRPSFSNGHVRTQWLFLGKAFGVCCLGLLTKPSMCIATTMLLVSMVALSSKSSWRACTFTLASLIGLLLCFILYFL